MMRFRRPAEPARFADRVRPAQDAVLAQVMNGQRPTFPDKAWGEYKGRFARAQRGRCGYCDRDAIAGQDGDVEHFAPKASVRTLSSDPQKWGREVNDGTEIADRETHPFSLVGYWWLAYDWNNYLLACAKCNRRWKRNLFPTSLPRANPPSPSTPDAPLLLNPFHGPKPSQHLVFTSGGTVSGTTLDGPGGQTVRTCGLNRSSLVKLRREKAENTFQVLREMARTTGPAYDRAARDLLRMGDVANELSGMVRCIAEQALGMAWQTFVRKHR